MGEQAGQDYFEHCIPLCSNHSISKNWLKGIISTSEVSEHFRRYKLLTFNLTAEIRNITAPVLYLANAINLYHLLSAARKKRDYD